MSCCINKQKCRFYIICNSNTIKARKRNKKLKAKDTKKARKKFRFLASLYYVFIRIMSLYECCNDFFTGTWQHIDDRNLWHGVATWLETE